MIKSRPLIYGLYENEWNKKMFLKKDWTYIQRNCVNDFSFKNEAQSTKSDYFRGGQYRQTDIILKVLSHYQYVLMLLFFKSHIFLYFIRNPKFKF